MITLTKYKNIPLLGFAAYSGTGKTTLLEQLIPELNQADIQVALIKHTHHEKFDIDQPGKDSYRLRKAGAHQVLVASAKRWALMVEQPSDQFENKPEPDLSQLLPHLDLDKTDLILVEGFKHEAISKIELHRPALEKPLLHPHDPDIVAIASDQDHLQDYYPEQIQCPVLDINNIQEIALFIKKLL
ncbi:MAG: molybdopterin-guanine dinucleotide biosynthesis protein B [gamma proteobacterium symbiont of Taylorina sp.]|nr:molybdopterin-guanine dinucleotide biosynthesis protein B [gamma proteobacterium symbiont of Taylorina sp.]